MSAFTDSTARSFAASVADDSRAVVDGGRPANENDLAVSGDAVLDVEEVARLLRVGRNTIYELVARNQIPHRRLLKQIRFSRASVMAWLGSCGHSQGAQ